MTGRTRPLALGLLAALAAAAEATAQGPPAAPPALTAPPAWAQPVSFTAPEPQAGGTGGTVTPPGAAATGGGSNAGGGTGQPSAPATDPSGKTPDISVAVGQPFVLRPTLFAGEVVRPNVSVDRPDMIDFTINPANKSEATFTGSKLGFVRVTFYNPAKADAAKPEDRTQRFLVQIVPDVVYLNRLVRARFPTANLNVVAAGDNLLFVDGTVDSPNDVAEVDRLLNRYYTGGVVNNLKVGGVSQVQLEVVIARVDRTELRRLGFNGLSSQRDQFFGSQVGNLINVPAANLASATAGSVGATFAPVGTGGPALNGAVTAFYGVTNGSNAFFGFVEALKQRNVVKVLANPTLVTLTGRPADFLVGGEQPIPTAISLGVPSVAFKPFGTRLSFLPTVLGEGRIRLDVVPEVSSLNFNNSIGVSAGGGSIPQFVVQRLHAVVEMQSGQTLCLGGLLQTEQSGQVDKVPVLGSLPFVGAAFRRTNYRTVETELLVIVTPRLVDPLRGCQVPAAMPGQESQSPTDAQLYIRGRTEAPPDGGPARLGDGIPPAAGQRPVPTEPAYPAAPIRERDADAPAGPHAAAARRPEAPLARIVK